jgi:hypothetical protein
VIKNIPFNVKRETLLDIIVRLRLVVVVAIVRPFATQLIVPYAFPGIRHLLPPIPPPFWFILSAVSPAC